jgi:2,3-bisphosphoglycerate-independent phosphoglycerate mutase
VLFFMDGVGIGAGDPEVNPFASTPLPHLSSLLDGARLLDAVAMDAPVHAERASVTRVDVSQGVEGRPQSGTGQTALLTGVAVSAQLGRHFGPWVPTSLRPLLESANLFQLALRAGHSVAFANAYPRNAERRRELRRPGAFPFAARAAGVLNRHEEELRAGEALPSSIDSTPWRRYVDPGAPLLTPLAAGRTLARIAGSAALTVFAHYDTDLMGHRRDMEAARRALRTVDEFLGALLPDLPPDTLLLITSDHGNVEDVSTGHTKNPVPLVAVGPGRRLAAARVREITDVAPLILEMLSGGRGG